MESGKQRSQTWTPETLEVTSQCGKVLKLYSGIPSVPLPPPPTHLILPKAHMLSC